TARKTQWTCPMCCRFWTKTAFAQPCQHQFCLLCILQWANRTSTCPLCRRQTRMIKFTAQGGHGSQGLAVIFPEQTPGSSSQADQVPAYLDMSGPDDFEVSPPASPQELPSLEEQGAAETEVRATTCDLLPEDWATLFRRHQHLIDPALPWLHQELEAIYGQHWWLAKEAETLIMYTLCCFGLDEEAVVQLLQPSLGDYIAPLVHGLISIIVERCSKQAQRLQHFHSAGDEDDRPAARSGPTTPPGGSSTHSLTFSSNSEGSDTEGQPSTSEATLNQHPGLPSSVPVTAEQEQPQEELEDAVLPGPSGQGYSHSPPSLGQDSDPLAGQPRSHRKRRASDSPQPCKRPDGQEH
ncbi:PHRF1 protein, partial [Centropus bengalensis]|nr:PHRF1 protein [Centropus bengalensis]